MTINTERIRRDIENINAFNATPGKGITRLTFSEAYLGAFAYVIEQLNQIGAVISICPAGNLRARIPGSEHNAPAVMMGSHLDSVTQGGPFDGVVGIVTALEAARNIVEDRVANQRPVDVVIFAEEEGSRFGRGLLGSSIWTGKMVPEQLNLIADANGVTYSEAMAQAGLKVDDNRTLHPAGLKAMLEVHIEQGAVLEKGGHRIGVVEAIAGIRQLNITIKGRANHAGTTPMPDRLDALQAAARIIVAVDKIAAGSGPETVATVGRISCEPAQVNVIPGLARFSIDVRDANKNKLEAAVTAICRAVEKICAERGLTFEIAQLSEAEPVVLDNRIINLLAEKARQKNVTPLPMISGAGHDTALVAQLTPAGMIFVPSRDGLSHCPQEFSRLEDIALGCGILLAAVVELAA
jgi:allantoate deiminase